MPTYTGLMETIAVLADPDAMAAIEEHERDPQNHVSAAELDEWLRDRVNFW